MQKIKITYSLPLSGGLDSTSLLCYLLDKIKVPPQSIICFYFNYGSRQTIMEKRALKNIIENTKVKLHYHRIPDIAFGNTLLREDKLDTISSIADKAGMEQVIVPGRNLLFISAMVNLLHNQISDTREYQKPTADNPINIVMGAHSQDDKFPDCQKEFFNPLSKAIQHITNNTIKLQVPFIDNSKAELAKHCRRELVNFTYSCYAGTDPACGKCMTCLYRKQAIENV